MADHDDDYLGYRVYAQTLWARIQAALDKDLSRKPEEPLGDDPLVVGILGEWGAGKSFLLKKVLQRAQHQRDERIAAHQVDTGFTLTVPVFFQPWKYEHEQHLLVPLLLHIEAELSTCLKKAQSTSDKAVGAVSVAADRVKTHLPAVVEGFKNLLGAARTAYQLAEPASAGVLLPIAEWLAGQLKGADKPIKPRSMREFRWDADSGRSFYELHDILQAVTRPTESSVKDHLPKANIRSSFRINFVIFIDDLDRCLPEKAVEALELIKTIFNLESFAFVLALDEEVVERGIGHRYKDYALANKKPEMPITGFEYLEKIVHLPFRLPALTDAQALDFLTRQELELLDEQARRRWPGAKPNMQAGQDKTEWLQSRQWFSKPRLVSGRGLAPESRRDGVPVASGNDATDQTHTANAAVSGTEHNASHHVHLAHLVVGCFNAHVPRKLIRVVELFNQVQDVLEAMKPPRRLEFGGAFDPRAVLALLLVQLFQPDLYRSLRRSSESFELFLDAFKPAPADATKTGRPRRQLSATTSDADLLHWAVYFLDEQPPGNLRAAQQRIPRLDVAERHAAQHKRLPLAERVLEHRCIARHPFDPMKLMQLMEQSARPERLPLALNGSLFALLSREALVPQQQAWAVVATKYFASVEDGVHSMEEATAGVVTAGSTQASARPQLSPVSAYPSHTASVEAPDVNGLFLALVAPDEATQKTVAQVAGLAPGQALGPRSAQALVKQIERDFLRADAAGADTAAMDAEREARRQRLTQGLAYLAPYLDEEAAKTLWILTGLPKPEWDPLLEIQIPIKQAAQQADLYSAMGLDDRFDPKRWHLPKARYMANTANEEPIPGFVWVVRDEAPFQLFSSHLLRQQPYCMARYLTTVDQYAHFVAEQGYGDPAGKKPDWWDTLGWAWRTGQWDSQVKEKYYREYLELRKPERRGEPMSWAEQRPHGSRPVTRLNWFEARAYANWLTLQLKDELGRLPAGYAVRLPTEAQWERAVRTQDQSTADDRQYPWGGEDAKTAHQHANVHDSDIDGPNPVGLFAANPLGLCDLSGNVWEWQNNLYMPDGNGQDKGLVADVQQLKTHEDWEKCDRPALRGGAWSSTADSARASVRNRDRPDDWDGNVGFRVVLSLAE